MQNIKLNRNTIIIGLIILVGAIYFLPKILGNDNSDSNNNNDNPSGNSATNTPMQARISAKSLQLKRWIGMAVLPTVPPRLAPAAPSMSLLRAAKCSRARLSLFACTTRGRSSKIYLKLRRTRTTDNTCINFVFEPTQGAAFQPGQYEAEFVVNGNQSDSVTFQVR